MENFNSSSILDSIPNGEKIDVTIALLKESKEQHNFRLMKLENKFDKLQENIENRFDKFEESNEARRRELIAFQEKIANDIKRAIDLAEKNASRINEVKNDSDAKIKNAEKEIDVIKEEVKTISSLKLKLLGVIGFIGFMFMIWGRELFKLFTATTGN